MIRRAVANRHPGKGPQPVRDAHDPERGRADSSLVRSSELQCGAADQPGTRAPIIWAASPTIMGRSPRPTTTGTRYRSPSQHRLPSWLVLSRSRISWTLPSNQMEAPAVTSIPAAALQGSQLSIQENHNDLLHLGLSSAPPTTARATTFESVAATPKSTSPQGSSAGPTSLVGGGRKLTSVTLRPCRIASCYLSIMTSI